MINMDNIGSQVWWNTGMYHKKRKIWLENHWKMGTCCDQKTWPGKWGDLLIGRTWDTHHKFHGRWGIYHNIPQLVFGLENGETKMINQPQRDGSGAAATWDYRTSEGLLHSIRERPAGGTGWYCCFDWLVWSRFMDCPWVNTIPPLDLVLYNT